MSRYDSDNFSDFFNSDTLNTSPNDQNTKNTNFANDYKATTSFDSRDDNIHLYNNNDIDSDNSNYDDYDITYDDSDANYDDSYENYGNYDKNTNSRSNNDDSHGNNSTSDYRNQNNNRADKRGRGGNMEEIKMRKKLRKSKKSGIMITLIQLAVSVLFMAMLYFGKSSISSIITMPVYVAIGVILGILFLITFTMQFKRLLTKRLGKVLSVIIIIVLLIGCYFIYPLIGTKIGGTSKVSEKAFVLYLSGNDSFGEMSKTSNGRTDTNILAVVNPQTYTALLLSTPRDAYVELIGDDIPAGNYDKLTHAGIYGSGVKDAKGNWGHGCTVSMNILSEIYDVKVDHYLRLNFTGFADLVDNLGGVTIDIPKGFSTYTYGKSYTFKEGTQKLTGDEALTYVRERHSFATGDLQRGANQVAVIQALVDQALSANTIKNYASIVKSIDKSFETDLDISSLAALQLQLQSKKDYNGWNMVSYATNGSTGGGYKHCYSLGKSASVVTLDDDSVEVAKQLIAMVLNGEEVNDKTADTLSGKSSKQ